MELKTQTEFCYVQTLGVIEDIDFASNGRWVTCVQIPDTDNKRKNIVKHK